MPATDTWRHSGRHDSAGHCQPALRGFNEHLLRAQPDGRSVHRSPPPTHETVSHSTPVRILVCTQLNRCVSDGAAFLACFSRRGTWKVTLVDGSNDALSAKT